MNKNKREKEENTWELSKNRKVTISQFKGQHYVDIREYYEDKETKELKPGKKGISLPVEQFKDLIKIMPEVQDALEETTQPPPKKIKPSDA